jgi:periplasmic protein CpxP/Spy
MKRETLLTISVVMLLLLNLGTLGYLFLGQRMGSPHHPPRVDKIIIETLHWNAEQQSKFDILKHEHRSQMNELDDKNREIARGYFMLLNATSLDTAQKDSLEKAMASIEAEKADITFRHFEDLKRICTAEQAKNFDALIPQLIDILLAPRPKHFPPPSRRD